MSHALIVLIALLQVWATPGARHEPSRLATFQQAGVNVRQPVQGGDDDSERMVIVHEHQHVHEHTHEHEHVHEHEHTHEHEHSHDHEMSIAAPAPAAGTMVAPAAPVFAMPITTTPDPPTLEPAMSRVVIFDEEQLDANVQRMAGSMNTVTAQLNHLRDTLLRWSPSLTTLQTNAAADLAVVTRNQATFLRLRGTISQAAVDQRVNPLLANIAMTRASAAAISAQLEGQPQLPPGGSVIAAGPAAAGPAAAGPEAGGNISHRIQTFNSTLILAKPAVSAKLEELRSVEEQLNENVTEYTDHVARAATDDILREIPNQLAGQLDNVMNRLDQ